MNFLSKVQIYNAHQLFPQSAYKKRVEAKYQVVGGLVDSVKKIGKSLIVPAILSLLMVGCGTENDNPPAKTSTVDVKYQNEDGAQSTFKLKCDGKWSNDDTFELTFTGFDDVDGKDVMVFSFDKEAVQKDFEANPEVKKEPTSDRMNEVKDALLDSFKAHDISKLAKKYECEIAPRTLKSTSPIK